MTNKEMMVDGELLDKLIQKTVEMLGDMRDINLLVRRLPASAEAIAEVNARIDGTQFAIKGIEGSMAETATDSRAIRKAIEGIDNSWKDMKAIVEEMPGKLSIPTEKIDGLREDIAALMVQLHKPLVQEVVHEHNLEMAIANF
jgi:hypothetical protein